MENSRQFKPIPHFKTEDEERAFWAVNDSGDYIDWSKAETAHFPNLKMTTKTEMRKIYFNIFLQYLPNIFLIISIALMAFGSLYALLTNTPIITERLFQLLSITAFVSMVYIGVERQRSNN